MKSLRSGVLLVNLGTPRSPSRADVRHFLREFLMDPLVIDIPAPFRWLFVHALILPFRPARSARAYEKVWTDAGSPILVHGMALRDAVARALGPDVPVELAMRYGNPSIADALERLHDAEVDRISLLPLFPQYSAAASGSAIRRVFDELREHPNPPDVHTVHDFYDAPAFIAAVAKVARGPLAEFRPDHVLFSHHGLPERQIRAADASGGHCFANERCCDAIGDANRDCYRAQCFATSRALAQQLDLADDGWSVAFQSRLGRTPWIEPYTDVCLPRFVEQGVKRLAVLCPSFVADCLETLEEIGIRARETWKSLGGEALLLVPCVNADPAFVSAVTQLVESIDAGEESASGVHT